MVITDEPHAGKLARVVLAGLQVLLVFDSSFSRYLITLLLLAAGAPLLTIAHLFWNNLFRRDYFTYLCQILLLLSTAGTISMCFDSFEQERFDAFESIVLIPLPTRSMLFMISAHDSIAMYLAIEPQSLCFYVIAASKRKSEFSTEAGSKYLILGAFPSGILLFGYDRTTTDILIMNSITSLYHLYRIVERSYGAFWITHRSVETN